MGLAQRVRTKRAVVEALLRLALHLALHVLELDLTARARVDSLALDDAFHIGPGDREFDGAIACVGGELGGALAFAFVESERNVEAVLQVLPCLAVANPIPRHIRDRRAVGKGLGLLALLWAARPGRNERYCRCGESNHRFAVPVDVSIKGYIKTSRLYKVT